MSEHTMKKAKEEWLKRVMASRLNQATKVFAWAVMDRMYGNKTVSNPGGALIKDMTGIGTNKQGQHRKALEAAGALTCNLVKNDKGDWDNYEYTLNLDWDGSTDSEGVTQRGTGSTPEGNTLPPTREQGIPQKGTGVLPTGEMNLSKQSPKESINQSFNQSLREDGPVVVDTPTASSNSSNELRWRENAYPTLPNLKDCQVTYLLNSEGVTKIEDSPKSRKPVSPKVIGGSRKVDMSFFNMRTANFTDAESVAIAREHFANPDFHAGQKPIVRYLAAVEIARKKRVSA